jgi:HEAT repeat protein
MFRNTRIHLSRCLALLGLALLTAPALTAETEADLLATLNNKQAELFDKAIACKQLAVVGSEAAVPVLAALLDDEKLSHYARYGLEPIPSPKVDDALQAALGKLHGGHLIGAINSIATRGKPAAIAALAAKLSDSDRAVAVAAAHSIARLGTPQAAEILGKAMSPEFAAPGLVCGKTLGRQGHTKAAVALLLKVHSLDAAPTHVRMAAMLQATEMQQAGGLDLLTAALTSSDKDVFRTGLRTARLMKQAGAAKAVLAALPKATPAQTALLITLLGDLADPAGLPAVLQAAASSDPAVRVAALGALATLGSAAHVKLLIDAALDKSEDISAQAQKTLVAFSGVEIDQSVLAALDDEARRTLAIRLIGQRRITAAVPKLLALLDGPNRLEVIAALGETIPLAQLDVLGKLLSADSPELREAVRDALHAACSRTPDRNATGVWLAAYLKTDSEEIIRFVIEELRRIGGVKALETVAQAAKGPDGVSKDFATQALGEWLDISAAAVLLELAKSEGATKYGVRALRGYIRLARQFSMPDEERLGMCRTALATTDRPAEKRLVLDVLQRNPSVAGLKLVAEVARTPALKKDAARAGAAIAEKLDGKSAEVQAILAQIGPAPVKAKRAGQP